MALSGYSEEKKTYWSDMCRSISTQVSALYLIGTAQVRIIELKLPQKFKAISRRKKVWKINNTSTTRPFI